MKFSAAAAMVLGMAPLALGKAVHNVYPVRRDGHLKGVSENKSIGSVQATEDQIAQLTRLIGLHKGSGTSINFLWVNIGGGAATTVIGAAQTVTVTQTVGGGAAATPPPAVATGNPTEAAPPSGTVGAGGATHSVTVGGPQGLAFSPQELKAPVGDTVIFTFLSQNHTATQSTFDAPCVALDGGMDSGYQANPNNTVNPPPQVAMQVMVGTPLCKPSPISSTPNPPRHNH
jgi:plastocyanin